MEEREMLIVLFSNDNYQVSLLKCILELHDIDIIHLTDREQIKKYVLDQEYMAIVLDLPNPTQEDLLFWSELIKFASIPILLLSSDKTDVNRVLSRQQATLHLAGPISKLFQHLYLERDNRFPAALNHDVVVLSPGVIFDVAEHCIRKNNEALLLSSMEFKLLYFLVQNMGSTLSTDELIDHLDLSGYSNLYVHVQKLRQKIENDWHNPHILVNQRGHGYKIIPWNAYQQSQGIKALNE